MICVCAAALAAAAFAGRAVDFSATRWEGHPFAWRGGDDASAAVSALGVTDLASLKIRDSDDVSFSARVKPGSAETSDWATLGVSVAAGQDDYWHVALVQCPVGKDGKPGAHNFELCERLGGVWLAHTSLKRVKWRKRGPSWEYGGEYDLSVSCSPSGAAGTVRDAKSGELLFEAEFAFPPPDATGAVAAAVGGRPALHSTGGFKGEFSGFAATVGGKPSAALRPAPPPYKSDAFVPGVASKATGFFRVEKADDGRWWAMDPLGRGTALLGVDHVGYGGMYSQRTHRSPYNEANKRNFASVADWEADTLAKLKSWGFTMLGAGGNGNPSLRHRGLAHAVNIHVGDGICGDGMPDEYFICPNEHRPCSAMPNVFHPGFPAWCDHVARRKCAPNAADQWLVGYFLDNELAWWGRGAGDTGLFDAVEKLPDGHPAKAAQRDFLRERGVAGPAPKEVKRDFLRLAADLYFRHATEAIRRHDPNHMILGCRFAGLGGADPVVWEVAGKYSDIVTFNCYPWADIDRNVVFTGRGSGVTVADAFAERQKIVGRPMLVTEWSFPALDTGRPCLYGAGQRFRTQDERTRATALFARTMLSMPFLVGYDYFMWVDQPAAGLSDAFPEDSNYGLLNEDGVPYAGLVSMFKRLHSEVGKWRATPPPAERPAPPSADAATAQEFLARIPRPEGDAEGGGGVVCEKGKDGLVLRNGSGLALRWRMGAKEVFDSVLLGDRDLGVFNVMLCEDLRVGGGEPGGGSFAWTDAKKTVSAKWNKNGEGGRGSLTVVSEGRRGEKTFRFTVRVTPLEDSPAFLAELVELENTGSAPIAVDSVYFRQYAPFAVDSADAKPAPKVPNLWKGLDADCWMSRADGTFVGAYTTAPNVKSFRYAIGKNGKSQHPDAAFFAPNAPMALAPGAKWKPRGAVWILAVAGVGGPDVWRAAAGRFR